MTKIKLLIVVFILVLPGCATMKEVPVPVPVKPTFQMPQEPKKCIPKDASDVEFLRCEFIDLENLRAYVLKLEAILRAFQ